VTQRDGETRPRGYYYRIVKAQAKDLGPGTAATTRALTHFDPAPTWSRF
jgi:hypothetical protein